jgi:hypothetical protein
LAGKKVKIGAKKHGSGRTHSKPVYDDRREQSKQGTVREADQQTSFPKILHIHNGHSHQLGGKEEHSDEGNAIRSA